MLTFKATWAGRCPACGERIERGQLLTWFTSGLFEKVACHIPCVKILKTHKEQQELALDFVKFLKVRDK